MAYGCGECGQECIMKACPFWQWWQQQERIEKGQILCSENIKEK